MSSATPSPFQIICLLASHGKVVVELKFLDQEPEQEQSNTYRWIFFDVEKTKGENLDFLDQDQEDGVEYREFKQGNLSFDNNVGQLLLNDGTGFALDRLALDQLDPKYLELIQKFIGK